MIAGHDIVGKYLKVISQSAGSWIKTDPAFDLSDIAVAHGQLRTGQVDSVTAQRSICKIVCQSQTLIDIRHRKILNDDIGAGAIDSVTDYAGHAFSVVGVAHVT